MKLTLCIMMLAAAPCFYSTRDATENKADAEPEKPRRKMTACERCESARLGCMQGQGFDESARAIAGLPPLPRHPCPDCSYACASEE